MSLSFNFRQRAENLEFYDGICSAAVCSLKEQINNPPLTRTLKAETQSYLLTSPVSAPEGIQALNHRILGLYCIKGNIFEGGKNFKSFLSFGVFDDGVHVVVATAHDRTTQSIVSIVSHQVASSPQTLEKAVQLGLVDMMTAGFQPARTNDRLSPNMAQAFLTHWLPDALKKTSSLTDNEIIVRQNAAQIKVLDILGVNHAAALSLKA